MHLYRSMLRQTIPTTQNNQEPTAINQSSSVHADPTETTWSATRRRRKCGGGMDGAIEGDRVKA